MALRTIIAATAVSFATLPAFAQSPPTIAKGFSPSGIQPNGVSTLTITLNNPNPSTDLNGVQFTDSFPANLVVATPNGLTNTCGGTPTATAGSGSISLTGSTITANSTCTVNVNVTAPFTGEYDNTTGPVSSTNGGTGTTSNTASLFVANPPTISKIFLPSSITQGGNTLLSFALENPNSNSTPPNSDVTLTGVSFTDALPAGLVVASPSGASNSCGGTFTATPGSGTLGLTGGTIPPVENENGGACFISVEVMAAGTGTYNNTTGPITANESGQGATSNTATLTVSGASAPAISKSFGAGSIAVGGSTTLTFTISNPNAGPLTGVGFSDPLPSGLVVANPNGVTNTCGGTVTAAPGSGLVSLTGGGLAANLGEGSACNISLLVTGTSVGNMNNTTGPITSDQTGSGSPSNTATVTVTQGSSTTAVSSAANPSVFGQTVTFTATVSGGGVTPTGTVTFAVDGGSPNTETLNGSGQASFSTSSLSVGSHTIAATYGGDGNYAGSAGSLPTQTVNKVNSTTGVVSSANPSLAGQPVTFTAAVAAASPGSGTPTGAVNFLDGGSVIGAALLSGGAASFTISTLSAGAHTITASYSGDGNFNGSTGPLAGNPQVVAGVPTVTALAPNAGPLSGGTSVTITGTNFTGATAVNFASVSASQFTVNSATQITATSPAESAGTIDVTVTTPAGASATSAADHFLYTNGPTVSAVTPKGGPTAGSTVVTVSGANFNAVSAVKFGSVPATTFTVNSSTQLTATSPAESTGTVDITVTASGGTSPTSAADQFTFGPPPAVTAVSPAAGPTLGGTVVAISGTGLAGATAVNFGSTAATSFTVNSPTSITATAPTGIVTVDVTVTTANGTSPTSAADQFSYEPSHDFNGDGNSDVLWRDTSNNIGMWLMNGASILQSKVLGKLPDTWAAVGQRDFNDDGKSDILWRDNLGNVGMWLMNGTQITSSTVLGLVPTTWSVAATGDFNSDGKGDIVWRDNLGDVGLWLMNGASILQTATLGNLPTSWTIAGADMKGELFLRNQSTGEVGIWLVNGTTITQTVDFGVVPLTWTIAGLGDFDGNGSTDILWRDTSGNVGIWLMNGLKIMSSTVVGQMPLTVGIAETGDFNGDGKSDILWIDANGNVNAWFMNGAGVSSTATYGNVGTTWTIQSLNAD